MNQNVLQDFRLTWHGVRLIGGVNIDFSQAFSQEC